MPLSQIPADMLGISQLGPTLNPTGVNFGASIIETVSTITNSYTVSTGSNAISAGPIQIANGITVTVTTGSVWTIV
jgi:hypothetical protein